MNRPARTILVAAFLLLACSAGLAADTYQVLFESGVKVAMRDGVVLRADIYRPQADGKFPVLLQRTPYDRRNETSIGTRGAQRGFVVIVVDVRGRYASEGEWYTFKNETNDGYDTIEWAAALPYSNGKVGMFGGSYVGATQMLAAISNPPHLAGLCPIVTSSNYHESWTYQGGAFEQWFNQSWTTGLAQNTLERKSQHASNATQGMWELPLAGYPLFNMNGRQAVSSETLAPYYLDWLAHPTYDDYWKKISIEEHFGDIHVPALHIAAWYDIFLGGSLRNYLGIKEHGGSDAARNGQQLMVIIGGHAGSGRKVGEVDFGPDAPFNEDEVILEWYDFLFKDAKNRFADGKPVKMFVLGENKWREEEAWPLARAKETKYFLHATAAANSSRGKGTLSTTEPGKETADQFVYDPAKPVPTVGGPLCCDGEHMPPGPRDQRAVESRDDVLIYSTPALEQDAEVTGPVSVELFAKSSAPDTDFTAKLVDVWPDGFAQNITEGIQRASFRDSREHPTLINPGQVYKFKIDLWATSNVFKKGHTLRLEVSSSNFPRFDRNLNTGNQHPQLGRHANPSDAFTTATNVILHDAERPSVLILPVIPAK
ncbi:MAG: CocE/NonD family hydrolase [Candidatus Acidiferrum sp.]|jgi:putative CocE/NonD family hydrolase